MGDIMDRWEAAWIAIVALTLAIFVGTLIAVAGVGYIPPSEVETAYTPTDQVEEFQPGVREIGDGVYEVNILAYRFSFQPNKIVLENPREIRFRIYSSDVLHGFSIVGTNVNIMVLPGYVSEIVWRPPQDFEGSFLFICNEYCGIGHSGMMGELVIVR